MIAYRCAGAVSRTISPSRSSAPAAIVTRYPGSATCRAVLTSLPRCLPRDLAATRPFVGDPREREEEIGQPIEVDDHELGNLGLVPQVDHPAFGAATDRACHVKG